MSTEPVAYIDRQDLERLPHHDCWVNGQEHKNSVPLYTHPAKTLTDDAVRYQWLRNEYAHGRETYLAEGMPSGEKLDEYIDEQLRKAQE
jgi:hypothetical protein